MEDVEDLLGKITANAETTVEDEQSARTILRDRFLRLITRLPGKECTFKTCENSTVTAQFKACDSHFRTIVVRRLKTPLLNYDSARLRVNDLISFHTFE